MLEDTIDRLSDVSEKGSVYIVTVKDQLDLALKNGAEMISEKEIIMEPEGRNTAPCVFLGLLRLLADGHRPDSIVAVLPSDHVIKDKQKFSETISIAAGLASNQKKIVTIGIRPTSPHTGYGYIKKGESLGEGHYVSEFAEKPPKETAEADVGSGNYFWNAGMFIAPISVLLDEFETHAREYFQYKDEILKSLSDERQLEKIYQKLPKDSIDYAIMEKSSEVAVVEALFDWNDLGSWDALQDVVPEVDNNCLVSSLDFRQIDAKDNVVFAPSQNVSLIGVKDLIIVSHGEELMILPKSLAQKVKELAN